MNASPASNTRIQTSGSKSHVLPRWQTVCRSSYRTG